MDMEYDAAAATTTTYDANPWLDEMASAFDESHVADSKQQHVPVSIDASYQSELWAAFAEISEPYAAELDDDIAAVPAMSSEQFMREHNLHSTQCGNDITNDYTSRIGDIRELYLESIRRVEAMANERRQKMQDELEMEDGIELNQASHLDPVASIAAQGEMQQIDRDLQARKRAINELVHKAINGVKEAHRPNRKRRNLNTKATAVLEFWYSDHIEFPYPNDADKLQLSMDAGIQVSQVNNWFSNKRNRKWAKDQKR